MSVKRSRVAFEADLQAQQSPFVHFGTPLPPVDPEVRDDGSYVPVWKQGVRDERGRKRFHGAFTGGFSAGYFNTVGSKEGWTPSTFVSSRSSRRKDDPNATQQRPEDFMDEEDLVEAEESRKLQTTQAFAAFGSTENDTLRATGLAGLFRTEGETMGTKLLKIMGWKEGQGIGPKIRRKARLGVGRGEGLDDGKNSYLFAPENVAMIKFERKMDHKGLGYMGPAKLEPLRLTAGEGDPWKSDDEDEEDILEPSKPASLVKTKKKDLRRTGIGIGVLNDTGSDEEDPYEIGPRISYNRVIGGDKKHKKKKETTSAIAPNPLLKRKPIFTSRKKNALGNVGLGSQKCHDGRLPLEGFVLGQHPDVLISETNSAGKYPPPEVPLGWKSSKHRPEVKGTESAYISTADVAKASKLDPKSRAALLGEKQLPGKSVFDFLSVSARDRLVSATGKTDLPEAKGEVPAEYAMSAEEKLVALLKDVPSLERETAVAAITRGASGGAPYADNEAKRSRYRGYLEYQAGFAQSLPPRPTGMNDDDWLREFYEFFNCAMIFKPMSGFMASRFTTSTSSKPLSGFDNDSHHTGVEGGESKKDLVSRGVTKPSDPAEEAAKMGMYGPMTRSTHDFYPTRLLCKRFNVKPPIHVQPDPEMESSSAQTSSLRQGTSTSYSFPSGTYALAPARELHISAELSSPHRDQKEENLASRERMGTDSEPVVDPSINRALEGQRAGEEVFRAIFGDSSDEEE